MAWSVPLVEGLAVLAVTAAVLAWALGLPWRWVRPPLVVLAAVALVPALAFTTWAGVAAGGDRSARTLMLGPGIVYERVAIDRPRPQMFHVATIDLSEPCVRFDATRPAPDGLVTAETATRFVARTGATLSINVAYFYPIREYPYWKAYPRSGDPITAIGRVVIDGEAFGRPGDPPLHRVLTVPAGPLPAAGEAPVPAPAGPRLALPGREPLVAGGRAVELASTPYPRTVAGINHAAHQLVLLVVDGKQPGYAQGSTYAEVSQFLTSRGVDEALELDGGGSATMAGLVDGKVTLLSRPSQQRLPGRQRPVATHLGVHLDPACR